jgi:methyl-accepting chemotaxis protein
MVLIPMSIMFYIFENQMKSLLVFTENEKLGVEYIVPVKDLIADIQQSRGLTHRYINHDNSVLPKIDQTRKQIVTDFAKLREIDARIGKSLKTNEQFKDIEGKWKAVVALPIDNPDLFEKHSEMINRLISLIAAVVDSSNLILDPDLDSYYLMDGIVNKIPLTMEGISKINGLGSGYLTTGEMNPANRDGILQLYSVSKVSSGDIYKGVQTAIQQNEALRSDLGKIGEANNGQANAYFKLIDQNILDFAQRKIQAEDFYAKSTNLIQENYKLFDVEAKKLSQLLDQRIMKYQNKINVFNIVILVAFLLLLYLFIGFYLSVSRSVMSIKKSLGLIEKGDLRKKVSVSTKDELVEIVNSINNMVASFRETVWNNQQIVNKVYEASSELSDKTLRSVTSLNVVSKNMNELAKDAIQQASNMDESSLAMREIAIGVQRVAESSSVVSDESIMTFDKAKHGGSFIQNAVKQMKNVQKSVDASAQLVEFLENKSSEIGEIVNIIKGISTQTSLLSLNASIEAARAGDHGKGFNVVAQEIKKLAEQSKDSAALITNLILEIQNKTNQLGVAMDTEVQEVTEGLKVILNIDEIFGGILESSEHVSENVQEISASSEQVSSSTEEVTASIDEMAFISKKSSDKIAEVSSLAISQLETIAEISSAANELLRMANESKGQLNQFII